VAPVDIQAETLQLLHDFEDSVDDPVRTPPSPWSARGRPPIGHHDVRHVATMTCEITLVAPAGIEPAHKV
jgi:hypothetical protein